MWEGCHLPLHNPLLTCFTHRPVCSLAPQSNSNSCDPSQPTICQFLAVQQITRQTSPFKINCPLNVKCDLPFKLTNINNLHNLKTPAYLQKHLQSLPVSQNGQVRNCLSSSYSLKYMKAFVTSITGKMRHVLHSSQSMSHSRCLTTVCHT